MDTTDTRRKRVSKVRSGLERLWSGLCRLADWMTALEIVFVVLVVALMVIVGTGASILRCVGDVVHEGRPSNASGDLHAPREPEISPR